MIPRHPPVNNLHQPPRIVAHPAYGVYGAALTDRTIRRQPNPCICVKLDYVLRNTPVISNYPFEQLALLVAVLIISSFYLCWDRKLTRTASETPWAQFDI